MNRRIAVALGALLALPATSLAVPDLEVRPTFVPPVAPEIVEATPDENTLVATQGTGVGVWNIRDADNPVSLGFTPPADDATTTDDDVMNISSVSVVNARYALAAAQVKELNRDYVWVIDLQASPPSVVREIAVADWPDSIDVSPDRRYAAVAIENECEGLAPVASGANAGTCVGVSGGPTSTGSLEVMDVSNANPALWTTTNVPVPADPDLLDNTDVQPEFVDINAANKVAVTFQENNGVGILDLATRTWDDIWSAGTATFSADSTNDSVAQLLFNATRTETRDPDAIKWIAGGTRLITANEGEAADADNNDVTPIGGARGYTIWTPSGTVVADTAGTYDKQLADFGFVSDHRSAQKGIEPEGLATAIIDGVEYAFVNNERGFSFAMIDVSNPASPQFRAVGPTGEEPEGIVALPTRRLIFTANEVGGQFSQAKVVDREALDPQRVLLRGTDTPFFNVLGAGATADGTVLFVDQNKPNVIRRATLGAPGYAPFTNAVTVDVALAAYNLQDVTPAVGGGYWVVMQKATGATSGDPDLVRLDASGAVVGTAIALSTTPTATGVAISPDGAYVYVSSSAGAAITRYRVADGVTDTVAYTASADPSGGRIQDLDITPTGDLLAVEGTTPGSTDATKSRSNLLRIPGPQVATGTITPVLVTSVSTAQQRSNRALTGVARLPEGDVWTVGGQRPGRNGNTDLRQLADLGPAGTAVPVISGTPNPGQSLTCSTGTWTGAASYARQWLRNGTAVTGATGATLALVSGDVGASITCQVTATGPEGVNRATSDAVKVVAALVQAPAASSPVAAAATGRRASATCTRARRTTTCRVVTRDPFTVVQALRGSKVVRTTRSNATGQATITVSRVGARRALALRVESLPLYALMRKA